VCRWHHHGGRAEEKIGTVFERFEKGARESGRDPSKLAQDPATPPVLGAK